MDKKVDIQDRGFERATAFRTVFHFYKIDSNVMFAGFLVLCINQLYKVRIRGKRTDVVYISRRIRYEYVCTEYRKRNMYIFR